MQEVGREHASVHAFLVTRDATFHGDALWGGTEYEIFQILRGVRGFPTTWRSSLSLHNLMGGGGVNVCMYSHRTDWLECFFQG